MAQYITVDGRVLTISGFRENSASQLSQYPKWNSSTSKYDYKLLAFGRVKTYEVDCFEKDVAWADSNAKYLKDLMQAGTSVSFVVTITSDATGQTIHQETSTSVKVIGLSLSYQDIGTLNLRNFTASFQEAP